MEKSLISYSFNTGWDLFKKNWTLLISVFIIAGVVMFIAMIISSLAPFEEGSLEDFLLGIVIALINMFFALGIIRINLDISYGKEVGVGRLFSQIGRLWQFVVASILYSFMSLIGLMFLIIPGIFLAVKFYLYDVAIVDDEDAGPIDSLKKSWNLTKGNWWSLFGLLILLVLLNIAGLLVFIIGILITIPLSGIVIVCAYRYLSRGVNVEDRVGFSGEENKVSNMTQEQSAVSHGPMTS